VTDETGGHVVVINAESGEVAGRYSVGKRPRGLRLSRDGAQLFVALSGSPIAGPGVDNSKLPPADRSADGVGVLDLATGQLLRKLKGGQDPESFDVSLDGATLYVSNEESSEMSMVDIATGDVRSRVKVGGEPEGVKVTPSGKEVYVTCEEDAEVFAIDTASGRVHE
jgi:YVTN family beta-propeller protein